MTEALDGLLPTALPDADFGEEDGEAEGPLGSSPVTPLSTPSPATEASELGTLEEDMEARRRKGVLREEGEEGEEGEREALRRLHRILNAVPSVQLPKVRTTTKKAKESCRKTPKQLRLLRDS